MSDKYVSKTGLTYYHGRIANLFATQTALDTLDAKVDDIISEGGEPNVIEVVKVNGTALTPVQKAVDIDLSDYALEADVPTKVSDLTNDGDGTSGSKFATEKYVDDNGGKIDTIKVNGTTQTITNKAVDITVPTKASDLTNDGDGTTGSKFATEKYVNDNGGKIDVIKVNGTTQTITNKAVDITMPTKLSDLTNDGDGTQGSTFPTTDEMDTAIAAAVTSAYKYKGSVATVADLPASGNVTGDVWDVQATGINYAWTGTAWDALGQLVDTSLLWAKAELTAVTTAEIDAIVDGN